MKSHVSMECKVCLVCGIKFKTGALLLDRRMKQSLEMETVTGTDVCEKCSDLNKQGYVALVGVDASKSTFCGNTLSPEHAHRTGHVFHMKREAFRLMFDSKIDVTSIMVYVDQTAVDLLMKEHEKQPTAEWPQG